MQQFFDTLQTNSGSAIANGNIVVRDMAGNLTNIYATNSTVTPITGSSVLSDATGQVSFFAPDGDYQIQYYNAGTLYKTRTPVSLIDPLGTALLNDSGGVNTVVVTTAVVVGQSSIQYPQTVYPGLSLRVKINNTNTSSTTLQMGITSAYPVQQNGVNILSNTLIAGQVYQFVFFNNAWQLMGGSGSGSAGTSYAFVNVSTNSKNNNSITSDAYLTVTVPSAGTYKVKAVLAIEGLSGGAGGFRVSLSSSNLSYSPYNFFTAQGVINSVQTAQTAGSWGSQFQYATVGTGLPSDWLVIEGTLPLLTGASTIAVQWAQNTTVAGQPTTIQLGSYLEVTKIG